MVWLKSAILVTLFAGATRGQNEEHEVSICSTFNEDWCWRKGSANKDDNNVGMGLLTPTSSSVFDWSLILDQAGKLTIKDASDGKCAFTPSQDVIDLYNCEEQNSMFEWSMTAANGEALLSFQSTFQIRHNLTKCVAYADANGGAPSSFTFEACEQNAGPSSKQLWTLRTSHTHAPTPPPTFPNGDVFTEMVVLLESRAGEDKKNSQDYKVGFGVSPGNATDFSGLHLQLKSLVKNDGNEQKMIWTMTKEGFIHPNSSDVVLYYERPKHHNWGTHPARGEVYLKKKSDLSSHELEFAKWRLTKPAQIGGETPKGMIIEPLPENPTNDRVCLTVMECNGPENEHYCSSDSRDVGCATDDCVFNIGEFIKLAFYQADKHSVQVFDIYNPIGDVTIPVKFPTRSPSQPPSASTPTPSPHVVTKFPTSAPPTLETRAPSQSPTHKAKGGNSKHVTKEEVEDVQSLTLALVLLLAACLLVVILLIVLGRRRQNRKKRERERMQFAFGNDEDFDDDDDQEFYSSFETDGKYTKPFQRMDNLSNRRTTSGTVVLDGDAAEPLGRTMSSGSFAANNTHVTHFEQEQGFVARV